MSVTSTVSKVIYTGTGSVATYAFAFNIWASTDLVLTAVAIDGTETTLALTMDYTVSLSHAAPTPGSITLVAGSLAAGVQLVIRRVLPLTQQINITDYSPTPAATWNEGYDRAVMLIQQLQEQLSRAVLQAVNATVSFLLPAPAANKIIGWNSTATALENKDLVAGPTGPQGPAGANGIFSSIASQAEAEAGTENTKGMTPLRTAQEIAAKVVKCTGAEIVTGTDDAKFATPKAIKDASIGVKVKVVNIQYGLTTSSGTQTVTGVGFTPKAVIFIAGVNSNAGCLSVGADDGTASGLTSLDPSTTPLNYIDYTHSIQIWPQTGNNYVSGVITSFNSDGFVITWTKTGSPTGTARIACLCFG